MLSVRRFGALGHLIYVGPVLGGVQRTPFLSARALGMSAEGLAEPQPQRRRTMMIPSTVAWRVVVSMPQSKESSRFFSVEAGDAPNLLGEKSCERERYMMRMCAAAKCSRQGGVVGLYAQRGPPPCCSCPQSRVFTRKPAKVLRSAV